MSAYRVLVVEDNHEVRRMVTASIKTLGADIDVLDVPSAEEALFISASLALDLVVLDFRLPGMNGIDLFTRLRKRRPDSKIILVTGVEDPTVRQQVADSKAEAFFYKPIEIDRFLEAVKRCLWAGLPEPAPAPPAIEPSIVSPEVRPSGDKSLSITSDIKPAASQGFMPTLDERLTTLKQQLRAVSVLLVNEAGQVLEVAGNPSQITSGSALLSSMMNAFHAGVQISQAVGHISSLQYFATQRQCLYVVPVGLSHALFVITSGYFEPDKLGTIDRYFQLAVRDLQDILARIEAEERARLANLEKLRAELPTQIPVDQETRQRVEDMFTQAAKASSQPEADSFWDGLGERDAQASTQGKDTLTYDQACDMGLAPADDKQG
jgi:CheY-like chemotaxis protein